MKVHEFGTTSVKQLNLLVGVSAFHAMHFFLSFCGFTNNFFFFFSIFLKLLITFLTISHANEFKNGFFFPLFL